MDKQKIEKTAFQYFSNGFHCAESVAKVLNDEFGSSENDDITKYASPFAGGIGKTHKEVCGALIGALIFLGANNGRTKQGINIDETIDLAAEFREKFLEEYGSTNCQDLLHKFGPQENSMECKLMVSKMAGIFAETIEKNSKMGSWRKFAES